MARKLYNVSVVWTLLLGCWGGVLAAAACPHLGCRPAAADGRATFQGEHEHGAAGPQKHSGHGAAELPSCHDPQPEPAVAEVSAFASTQPACAHCVGRGDAPPARGFEWQTNLARDNRAEAAPRDFGRLLTPAVLFVREVIPATHAPPGSADRYLLLSVFRI